MSSIRGPTPSSLGLLFVRVLPLVRVLLLVVWGGLGALFFVDMLSPVLAQTSRQAALGRHRGVVRNNAPKRTRFPPEGEIQQISG